MVEGLRRIALAALALAIVAVAAGCGSDDDDSASQTGSSSSSSQSGDSVLGTAKKATGSPYVVGMLNLNSGPTTQPEVAQAAQAAVDYVNDYRNGINGHPIQLEVCAADGQPSTSESCANQIADKDPIVILGGIDTGASGAFPVWDRNDLAFVGGLGFTPTENNAPNAVYFVSLLISGNGAVAKYVGETLGLKSMAIMVDDDTQNAFTAKVIANEMENAGVEVLDTVRVAPTSADLSSAAATAISKSPELVYLVTPNQCPAALKALQSVGYTGKLAGISPCTSPQALESAGSAAEGLILASAVYPFDADNDDAKLATAIIDKYAPKDIPRNSLVGAAIGSVMNLQATLSEIKGEPTTDAILSAFKTGSDHPNFLSHPYTCDGKQVPGESASCNSYNLIQQVKDGKVTTVGDWITGADLYTLAK